jgi:hypothetical protein
LAEQVCTWYFKVVKSAIESLKKILALSRHSQVFLSLDIGTHKGVSGWISMMEYEGNSDVATSTSHHQSPTLAYRKAIVDV